MDLSLLQTLKQKLQTATKFEEVQDYFLTHFGQSPEFIALGERTTHALLDAVIQASVQQLFPGSPARVERLILTRLAEQQFIHGGLFVHGHVGCLFYFEDIHKGLLSLSKLGGQTHYVRFSGRPMPPTTPQPSRN
jgi:hypothetical protein